MFLFCGVLAAGFALTAWIISHLESREDRNEPLSPKQKRALEQWRGLTQPPKR